MKTRMCLPALPASTIMSRSGGSTLRIVVRDEPAADRVARCGRRAPRARSPIGARLRHRPTPMSSDLPQTLREPLDEARASSRSRPARPGRQRRSGSPAALWWTSFASRLMMPYLKVVEKTSMCAPMRNDQVGLGQRCDWRSVSRCGRAARAPAGVSVGKASGGTGARDRDAGRSPPGRSSPRARPRESHRRRRRKGAARQREQVGSASSSAGVHAGSAVGR